MKQPDNNKHQNNLHQNKINNGRAKKHLINLIGKCRTQIS